MGKSYDPLDCIPSADVVRKRLTEAEELARKLGVLLRTAEHLERNEVTVQPGKGCDDDR